MSVLSLQLRLLCYLGYLAGERKYLFSFLLWGSHIWWCSGLIAGFVLRDSFCWTQGARNWTILATCKIIVLSHCRPKYMILLGAVITKVCFIKHTEPECCGRTRRFIHTSGRDQWPKLGKTPDTNDLYQEFQENLHKVFVRYKTSYLSWDIS